MSRKKGKSLIVQSLIFDTNIFKRKNKVKDWVLKNGFRLLKFKKNPIKKFDNTWRVRQRDPWRFQKLFTFRLKKGVKAVKGVLK